MAGAIPLWLPGIAVRGCAMICIDDSSELEDSVSAKTTRMIYEQASSIHLDQDAPFVNSTSV
jgi:hypothetical protein